MNRINTIRQHLTQPVNAIVIGIFRVLFGAFMIYEIIDYFRIGLVKNMFVLPAVNFSYDYLEWLHPLPEPMLNGILGILLVCAICITTGVFFRWSCRIFALAYLYIFLLDKSIYNNHIYLFILIAFLFSLTDADKVFSLNPKSDKKYFVPYWQQWILQFQLAVVYFYGGLAKLRFDWLIDCQPIKLFINSMSSDSFLSSIIKNDIGIYLFNYGGIMIDLATPFFLWHRKFRRWAIIPIILFHILNSIIFDDIGIFPFVMIASLLIFFDAKELPFIKHRKPISNKKSLSKNTMKPSSLEMVPFPATVILIFIVFQLIFPLRGYFLPNQQDWTTIGNRFSWRMKVDTRELKKLEFNVMDKSNNAVWPVPVNTLINDMQILNLSMDPRSSRSFAYAIKSLAEKNGMKDVTVKANIMVTYNGRPVQPFINPEINLTGVDYNPFKKLDWIYPVKDVK